MSRASNCSLPHPPSPKVDPGKTGPTGRLAIRPCINTLHCSPSTFVTSMGQVKPLASTCFFPQHLPDDMQSYTPTLLLWPWFVLMHKRKEALAILTLLGIGGVSAQLNIIKASQFYIIAHLSSSNIGSCSPCVCECSDLQCSSSFTTAQQKWLAGVDYVQ